MRVSNLQLIASCGKVIINCGNKINFASKLYNVSWAFLKDTIVLMRQSSTSIENESNSGTFSAWNKKIRK